jgi:peptide/nickel transport system substrate-binding protein
MADRPSDPTGRVLAPWRFPALIGCSLLVVLALSAQAGQGTSAIPRTGGTLTSAAYTSSQAPSTLFPVFNPPVDTIPETFLTLQQMWRPLIFLGTDNKVDWSKSVAAAVTHNASNTVYDIRLRPTFTWNDGQPVTANDQLYEWNLIKADCPPKACNWFYSSPTFPSAVSRFEVTGKYTFRLHLSQPLSPDYMILNNLTSLTPLPAHAWTIDPGTHKSMCSDTTCSKPADALANFKLLSKLGTDPSNALWQVVDGPFLPGPWVRNQSYTLVRNDKYMGGHKAYLDKIVFLYYASDAAEFQALKAGDVDVGYVPLDNVKSRNIPGYRFWNLSFWGYNPILLNQGNLNNPKAAHYCQRDICKMLNLLPVRVALQSMINQPAMIHGIFSGFAYATYSSTPAHPDTFLTALARRGPYPYSPDRAKQMLAKAGFKLENGVQTYEGPAGAKLPVKGAQLHFTLLYTPVAPYVTREALIWQSELKKIGVQVDLKGLTPDAIFGKLFPSGSNEWDAVTFVGGGSAQAYPTSEPNFTCNGSPFNVEGFCDPMMDKLINNTLVKGGPTTYPKFENFVATHLPHIWLPTPPQLLAETKTSVGNYKTQLSPLGYSPLEELYLTS